MSRSLTKLLTAISGGNFIPDTGETVKLVDAVSGADVTTAVETPAGSGNYVATWAPVAKFGYWKVGSTTKAEWGKVWLGVEGQLRPMYIFKKVEIYDAGDSPTGQKGDPRTFTSSSGVLATDNDGFSIPTFTNLPIVLVNTAPYQERGALMSTSPALSSGHVTFALAAGDSGDNSGDGKCYADIIIISQD